MAGNRPAGPTAQIQHCRLLGQRLAEAIVPTGVIPGIAAAIEIPGQGMVLVVVDDPPSQVAHAAKLIQVLAFATVCNPTVVAGRGEALSEPTDIATRSALDGKQPSRTRLWQRCACALDELTASQRGPAPSIAQGLSERSPTRWQRGANLLGRRRWAGTFVCHNRSCRAARRCP